MTLRSRLLAYITLGLVFALSAIARAQSGASASGSSNAVLPRIEWKTETLQLIQPRGFYARIVRLKDNNLVCGFELDRNICVRRSSDDGETWQEPIIVADWPLGQLTNAELLQLRNGTLLCFFNYRPSRRGTKREATERSAAFAEARYAIGMSRSADGGKTWSKAEVLYVAGAEFENGCWEPAAIELPSGEIQMFFSNEGLYRDSDEQEITLMRSTDGARTWSIPEKVSFRPKARDGMPVPLLLKDDRGIAFCIEDNGLSGNFKPVIVYSSLKDNWRSGTRTPDHAERWSALRELPPPHVAASAPYLRQMPTGETLLSFQRSDTGEIRDAYMVVCIGDEGARNFASPTRPFPVTAGKAQLWNSLFVKNNETIVAVTEGTIDGKFGIWSVEGEFIRRK